MKMVNDEQNQLFYIKELESKTRPQYSNLKK